MRSQRSMPALLALSLGYFAMGTCSLAPVGLNASIGSGLHVQPARVGLLVTIFALTFGIIAPFAPGILKNVDHKHALLLGLTILLVGTLLSAAAPNYGVLVAVRLVAAVGAAIYGPGSSATGALLVPAEHRQRALAIVFAGMTTATVLGVPLASVLGSSIGWRPTLITVAALVLVALAGVAVLVPRTAPGEPPTVEAYRKALETPAAVSMAVTTLLFVAAQFTIYGVAGAYLAARFNASTGLISTTLLIFGAIGLVGTLSSAAIAERLGAGRTVTMGLIGVFVGLAVLVVLPDTKLGIGVFVAWAFFSQVFMAPQQGRLVGLMPSQAGLILALNASGLYLGMSLGSVLGSALLPSWGARPLPAAGLVLLVLAGVTHTISSRRAASSTPNAADEADAPSAPAPKAASPRESADVHPRAAV